MNTVIMIEFLQWFDSQMISQKILLLMNNDSAHECAAKILKKNSFSLQNTQIKFFPANTISLFQSLDQGIIKNLKTLYQQY